MNAQEDAAMQEKHTQDVNRASRIWIIIEAALEYFISLMVTGAYLARITSSLGFSDSLTGILSSFVSLGCVFQLGSIAFFRRMRGVKKPIVVFLAVNQLLFVLVYLTPVLPLSSGMKTALFLVCFCGAYLVANLITPTRSSWFISLVDDRARGIFTARKEIVSLLGGMTFTYITGAVIDHLEENGQQRLAFILGAATIFVLMVLHAVCLLMIRPPQEEAKKVSSLQAFREILKDKTLLKIVLVGILWHIAAGVATPFYGAYQIKELGFSMTFISILHIAYSLVRVAFSPVMGRYADRHSFSRMVNLCFGIAGASFLVNCFTVPENGKVFYTAYFCLHAISMAGINSAITNLVFDYVKGEKRRGALAVNSAAGGVAGFLSTCLMSPTVALIQKNGNTLLGIPLYPAQFVSGAALLVVAALILYVRRVVIPCSEK